jgi:hypothetical protein
MQYAAGGMGRTKKDEARYTRSSLTYEQLLEEAMRLGKEHQLKAKYYVPRMYDILVREEGMAPFDAADRIYRDLVGVWQKDTIRRLLPAEAKNQAARERQALSRIKMAENAGSILREQAAFSEQEDSLVSELKKENERLAKKIEELNNLGNSHISKILQLEKRLAMYERKQLNETVEQRTKRLEKVIMPPELFVKVYSLIRGCSRPLVLTVVGNEVKDIEKSQIG